MAESNLKINITGDSSKLKNALSSASSRLQSFGSKMQNVGKQMSVRLTLPIVAAGGAAIKFASDFQESMNKVDVAFGNSRNEVKEFAKTTLKEFGIAEGSALDMAALFGDMATSMGLSTTAAAGMSTQLVGLAGDLASFNNINIEEAPTALAGVFTGETESLKRLGVVMTEVNLKNFAMEQGMNANLKTMSQAEKVALRYEFIMAKTSNAQGDFSRTSGGAANQMRIFQESLKELAARFGQIILPVFTKLVTFLNGLIQKFGELSPTTKKVILIFTGVVAALGPIIGIIGTLLTLAPAIGTALTVMTGPIGLVVAALTAVGVVIYKNWSGIKAALIQVGNYFIDLYNNALPIQLAVDFIIMQFKNFLAVGKFVLKSLVTLVTLTAKNIVSALEGVGAIIMGIFTLDPDEIERGFELAFEGVKNNVLDAFDDIKTEALNLGSSVVDNFNEALERKQIAKITVPVEVVSTSDGAQSTDTTDTTSASGGRRRVQGVMGDLKAGGPITNAIKADTAGIPAAIAEQQKVLSEQQSIALANAMLFNAQVSEIITGALNDLAIGIGEALGQAIAGGGNLAQSLSKLLLTTIGNMATQLGKLAIGVGIGLKKIQIALQSLSPGIAIAAGIMLVALGAFVKSQAGKISMGGNASAPPKFAKGGIVSGPTMGLVGEYPGARQNPEVIAPLNKLQSMIGGGNQNINVGGQIRLEGQDLLIAIQRANETADRLF